MAALRKLDPETRERGCAEDHDRIAPSMASVRVNRGLAARSVVDIRKDCSMCHRSW